jgi:hypothetical protein
VAKVYYGSFCASRPEKGRPSSPMVYVEGRACFVDRGCPMPTTDGKRYLITVVGESKSKTVGFVRWQEPPAVIEVDLIRDQLLGVVLADGTPAKVGEHFYHRLGEPGVVVPLGTKLWLVLASSRIYGRRVRNFVKLKGVHIAASGEAVEQFFSEPFESLQSKPSCPDEISLELYKGVLSLASAETQERWRADEERHKAAREEQRRKLALSMAASLRKEVAGITGRCRNLGDKAKVVGILRRVDEVAQSIPADSEITGSDKRLDAADHSLGDLDDQVRTLEEIEFGPYRRLRGVKDNVQAKEVRRWVQDARLKPDPTRWLQSERTRLGAGTAGEAIKLALEFLRLQALSAENAALTEAASTSPHTAEPCGAR